MPMNIDKIKLPETLDRRVKLTTDKKEEIKNFMQRDFLV